jgi:S-methylmethionine-dependent homocysteine/selenocysteine methylase
VDAVLPFKPVALFTNCAPPDVIHASVLRLLKKTSLPVGVYANGDGGPEDKAGWAFQGKDLSDSYADYGAKWWEAGATVVGACCGSNPEYIKKLDAVRKRLA